METLLIAALTFSSLWVEDKLPHEEGLLKIGLLQCKVAFAHPESNLGVDGQFIVFLQT